MATKRSVSKRTRFEVFKRDGFRCVYCGATPLQSALRADHVIAIADGGSNGVSNLATSCEPCNQGKGAVPLERKRLKQIATRPEKDHSRQILEYLAVQREIERAKELAVQDVSDFWEETVGPISKIMHSRLFGLMTQWEIQSLHEAMIITGEKMGSVGFEFNSYGATKQVKYFYGILRRWRNEGRA